MYFGRGMPSRSSRHAFAIPVPCGGRFSALWTFCVLSVIFAAVGVFSVDADVPHSAHAASVGLVASVDQVPVGRDEVVGAEFIGEAALGFPYTILFCVVLARQQRPRPGTFIVSKSVVVHCAQPGSRTRYATGDLGTFPRCPAPLGVMAAALTRGGPKRENH